MESQNHNCICSHYNHFLNDLIKLLKDNESGVFIENQDLNSTDENQIRNISSMNNLQTDSLKDFPLVKNIMDLVKKYHDVDKIIKSSGHLMEIEMRINSFSIPTYKEKLTENILLYDVDNMSSNAGSVLSDSIDGKNITSEKINQFCNIQQLEELKQKGKFTNIIDLIFFKSPDGKKFLEKLKIYDFKNTHSIELSYFNLPKEGVEFLVNCYFPKLNIINLYGVNLNDEGVEILCKMNFSFITELTLANNNLTDHSMMDLGKCNFHNLKKLFMSKNNITSKGIGYFKCKLDNLEI